MSQKITEELLKYSDRKRERQLFQTALQHDTPLRGLVLHSKGDTGTGKTTLLEMFRQECQKSGATALRFTANLPLDWQKILDETVATLGKLHFPTYNQLRQTYADRNQSHTKHNTIITNIGTVQGQVHTGSGDINSVSTETESSERPSVERSSEMPMTQEEIRVLLTQTFWQELSKMPNSHQLVWLVDQTEKLDGITRTWLIELFYQIAEKNQFENLVLVTAGQDLLCHEPYWEKVKVLHIGDFDEKTVLVEFVQRLWADVPAFMQKSFVRELMKVSGGKPLALTTYVLSITGGESYND